MYPAVIAPLVSMDVRVSGMSLMVEGNTFLLSRPVRTPLGQIRLAGRYRGGEGVPGRGRLREYGSWVLMCVTRGTGTYRDADGRTIALGPGAVVTVTPNRGYWYRTAPGETWDEIYVAFDGPTFDLWRTAGLLNAEVPVVELAGGPRAWSGRLDAAVTALGRARSNHGRLREFLRLLDVLAVPGLIAAASSAGEHRPAAPPWLQAAETMLSSDLGAALDPRAVAAALGTGYETFRKRFTAATGMPPARYRTTRRIEAAAELLRYSPERRNAEVASLLGFADEFHFSKRFRSIKGVSPRAWRRDGG